jgi:hypothetical protein
VTRADGEIAPSGASDGVVVRGGPRCAEPGHAVGDAAYRGGMTHSVFHRRYGIELNLTEDDLGHPDRPGLLAELYRNYRPDVLYCVDAYEHDGCLCPGFMTIRKFRGRPHAMHVPVGQWQETMAESDLHKALKEYTATTAEREGFAAQVEDRAKHGKRRTDVIVTGDGGRRLGYEIQLSAAHPS